MRRLIDWLSNLLFFLMVLCAVILVFLPSIFSSRLAIVLSGSMEPVMPVGAIAVTQDVQTASIIVGDIISFAPPWDQKVIVSHRVLEVVKEPELGFLTKGDANEDPDYDIIPASSVRARVVYIIPYLGHVMSFTARYAKGRTGLVLLVFLPTVLLIGSSLIDLNFMYNPRKKRERNRRKLLEKRKRRHLGIT